MRAGCRSGKGKREKERERERERDRTRTQNTSSPSLWQIQFSPITILHTGREGETYLKNALGFVKPDVQGESIRGSTKKRRRERHRENDFDREKAAATFPPFDSTTDRHDDVVAI